MYHTLFAPIRRIGGRTPLLKFSIQATGWLTKPWQKAFPSGEKTDWYCLPAGFLVYYLACTAIIFISPALSISNKLILANFWFAILHMLKAAAYTLLIALIIRMVSSIQGRYSPLTYAIERILQLLLKPFSFLRIGRYDFSGSLLALLLWLWLTRWFPQLIQQTNLWLLQ